MYVQTLNDAQNRSILWGALVGYGISCCHWKLFNLQGMMSLPWQALVNKKSRGKGWRGWRGWRKLEEAKMRWKPVTHHLKSAIAKRVLIDQKNTQEQVRTRGNERILRSSVLVQNTCTVWFESCSRRQKKLCNNFPSAVFFNIHRKVQNKWDVSLVWKETKLELSGWADSVEKIQQLSFVPNRSFVFWKKTPVRHILISQFLYS